MAPACANSAAVLASAAALPTGHVVGTPSLTGNGASHDAVCHSVGGGGGGVLDYTHTEPAFAFAVQQRSTTTGSGRSSAASSM